ncbi:MAG TPA: hypothetical protein VGM23_04505 [Armatimonadota bacterium]
MMKCLCSALAVLALLCGSAFAAPVALTNTQLDGVSAGSVFDYVFGSSGSINQASDNESTLAAEASFSAADGGSNAITGEGNTVTSAIAADGGVANNGGLVAIDAQIEQIDGENGNNMNTAGADNGANAVAGNCNLAAAVNLVGNDLTLDLSQKRADDGSALATDCAEVYQNQADDYSAVATDEATATTKYYAAFCNEDSNIIVGEGSGNSQTVDFMGIEDAEIEEGGVGQIAKTADASNSFNEKDVEIDVDVDIEDSFNNTTNSLHVCGQDSLTAIVNANALDDQNIGVNVNICTADSAVPTTEQAGNGAVSSFDGNAIAATLANQVTANNILILASPVF